MDCPDLFLVTVLGLWGTLLVLLGVQAARETVDWWHLRHRRGAHHPAGPAARTVKEIEQHLRREAARSRPARVVVVRRRVPAGPVGWSPAHALTETVPHGRITPDDEPESGAE